MPYKNIFIHLHKQTTNMETKHAKGQWNLIFQYGNKIAIGCDFKIIAITSENVKNEDEAYSNAKLIAAAPELLEALIKAQDLLEYYGHKSYMESNDKKQIDNVIKKATT